MLEDELTIFMVGTFPRSKHSRVRQIEAIYLIIVLLTERNVSRELIRGAIS